MNRHFFSFLLFFATMALTLLAGEPLALVYKDDGWGVVDRNGKTVLPTEFGKIYPYYTLENGTEVVYFWATYDKRANENSPSMLIDRNGKTLCEPIYNLCLDSVMHSTLGFVTKDAVFAIREAENGEKIGVLLYTDGLAVNTGLNFDDAIFCGTNLVKIVRNKKTFLWNIDKRYIERSPSKNDKFSQWEVFHFHVNKKAANYNARDRWEKNGGMWYADGKTGLPLTKEKYDQVSSPDWLDWWDGVFPAKLNGKWGFFKLDGTVVLPPQYLYIFPEPL